jgi:hypothetical protein
MKCSINGELRNLKEILGQKPKDVYDLRHIDVVDRIILKYA